MEWRVATSNPTPTLPHIYMCLIRILLEFQMYGVGGVASTSLSSAVVFLYSSGLLTLYVSCRMPPTLITIRFSWSTFMPIAGMDTIVKADCVCSSWDCRADLIWSSWGCGRSSFWASWIAVFYLSSSHAREWFLSLFCDCIHWGRRWRREREISCRGTKHWKEDCSVEQWKREKGYDVIFILWDDDDKRKYSTQTTHNTRMWEDRKEESKERREASLCCSPHGRDAPAVATCSRIASFLSPFPKIATKGILSAGLEKDYYFSLSFSQL